MRRSDPDSAPRARETAICPRSSFRPVEILRSRQSASASSPSARPARKAVRAENHGAISRRSSGPLSVGLAARFESARSAVDRHCAPPAAHAPRDRLLGDQVRVPPKRGAGRRVEIECTRTVRAFILLSDFALAARPEPFGPDRLGRWRKRTRCRRTRRSGWQVPVGDRLPGGGALDIEPRVPDRSSFDCAEPMPHVPLEVRRIFRASTLDPPEISSERRAIFAAGCSAVGFGRIRIGRLLSEGQPPDVVPSIT